MRSVVWFRRQPASWKAVLGLLVTEFRENQNVGFTLAGPFTEMPEEEKDFLFSNNVRLLYDRPPLPLTDCCRAVLEGLCEFGFKVPVIWFVTNSNIRAIRGRLTRGWTQITIRVWPCPLFHIIPSLRRKTSRICFLRAEIIFRCW